MNKFMSRAGMGREVKSMFDEARSLRAENERLTAALAAAEESRRRAHESRDHWVREHEVAEAALAAAEAEAGEWKQTAEKLAGYVDDANERAEKAEAALAAAEAALRTIAFQEGNAREIAKWALAELSADA